MKFIVITPPDFIADEARMIEQLFDCGLDVLHLRKPGSSKEACSHLLESLPSHLYSRIVTHDHFGLCDEFGLQGIHLNARNPHVPSSWRKDDLHHTVSASCHSICEVEERKNSTDYVFMSPVFDSISKQGYSSAYTAADLSEASSRGVIDRRVIALGGITLQRIPQLNAWHFGGAAFLGDVWGRAGHGSFLDNASLLASALHETE
ncbi:MAG: thiamine phosphate synthase [Prevotella sp.]